MPTRFMPATRGLLPWVFCCSCLQSEHATDCVETSKSLQSNEQAGPYKISVQETANGVKGSYTASLEWSPNSDEHGPTSVLHVEYDGNFSSPRYTKSEANRRKKSHLLGLCYSRVEFDAVVHLWSEDGAIDTKLRLVVRNATHEPTTASFHGFVPRAMIGEKVQTQGDSGDLILEFSVCNRPDCFFMRGFLADGTPESEGKSREVVSFSSLDDAETEES